MATIAAKEAGFRPLDHTWTDTTTAQGRLMLTVLGGLAEFERELIRARTGKGQERVKWEGSQVAQPAVRDTESRVLLFKGQALQFGAWRLSLGINFKGIDWTSRIGWKIDGPPGIALFVGSKHPELADAFQEDLIARVGR